MKTTYYLLLCTILLVDTTYSMTEKQMKSTANMLRQVCQPKTKPTNAQIDNMHKGDFEDDSKPKCYMKCIFDTLKIMKNGKYDYDAAIKQIVTLPVAYLEPTKVTAEKCKDAVKSSEACEAAYDLAKCWYFSNPDVSILGDELKH